MKERWRTRVRRWRRRLSRSEWLARLLALPQSAPEDDAPGLVLIQIDGLGRSQIERALARRRMPFLRRLLRHEEYRLGTFYSGQPSSTPAVQGEIFYGVRTAVPSWGFRMDGGPTVTMMSPEAAAKVQELIAEKNPGLLCDGTSYGNIYSGGAAESHFCSAHMGWGELLPKLNPLKLVLILLLNIVVAIRIAALAVIELGLAFFDFLWGIANRPEFREELVQVPARVGVGIILREIQTRGAMIDIARGVPIIHLNFLGYDEQAHRRGPGSAYAHWTLKGIDGSIKRIWRAAQRSSLREYQVWIYSDHGQEEVTPYFHETGRTIQEAVAAVFNRKWEEDKHSRDTGVQLQRVRLLGGRRVQGLLNRRTPSPAPEDELVVAKGPTGHVYSPDKLSATDENRIARALIQDARVPIVFAKASGRKVSAWTARGRFTLPEDAASVLGEDHPLLDEVARDLIDVVHHPWAGSFVISGWRPDAKPLSFPVENGSHAGPGREEVRGFVLAPRRASVVNNPRGYIRPLELRAAAMRLRQFGAHCRIDTSGDSRGAEIRVMTYNIHGGVGMDGRLDLERIARVIGDYEPDVVALQELDVNRSRSGSIDQARIIARLLEMEVFFHPALRVEDEQYGDAILSRLPMRLVKVGSLPGPARREPRGALWVEVEAGGVPIQILNTHFGLWRGERMAQARAFLGPEWLGHPECVPPRIVCGDFNSMPRSSVYRALSERLRDVRFEIKDRRARGSFKGWWHLDYIFFDGNIDVTDVQVPRTVAVRMASDHLPVVADFRLRTTNDPGAEPVLPREQTDASACMPVGE